MRGFASRCSALSSNLPADHYFVVPQVLLDDSDFF
jgi:hypothetical protein